MVGATHPNLHICNGKVLVLMLEGHSNNSPTTIVLRNYLFVPDTNDKGLMMLLICSVRVEINV